MSVAPSLTGTKRAGGSNDCPVVCSQLLGELFFLCTERGEPLKETGRLFLRARPFFVCTRERLSNLLHDLRDHAGIKLGGRGGPVVTTAGRCPGFRRCIIGLGLGKIHV